MRRTGLILGAVLGCVGLLAACGGGSGDDETAGKKAAEGTGVDCPVDALKDVTTPVDIRVWHAEIGTPKDALEKIAKKYNDSQDKVVVHMEPQGTLNEQLKKFEDSMSDPKSMPEIVMPDDTVTRFMADSGFVIPATSCIEADPDSQKIYDDMVPIVTSAFSIDDTLWPGAFNAGDGVLFFNESHFEKAGLDISKPPQTLNELRAAAQKLKDANIEGLDTPLVMRIDSWPLEFLISGAGQQIVNEDNGRTDLATKAEYDNQVTQEVFEWLRDMHRDGLLKYTDYSELVDPFIAMAFQTSSMLIDSSSAISTVDAAIAGTLAAEDVGLNDSDIDLSGLALPDLRIGIGEMPGLKAAGKGQVGGTVWYLVDDDDPARIAAAWDFMKFFNQPEQQVIWALDGSALPVRKAALDDPALKDAWNNTRLGKWMAVAYKGLESLDPDNPGPVIGPYKEFRQSVRNGLEDMILQGADADVVVKKINKEFQQALDSYKADLKD